MQISTCESMRNDFAWRVIPSAPIVGAGAEGLNTISFVIAMSTNSYINGTVFCILAYFHVIYFRS